MELKDQLEDIQKRVEDEIQAGVPPVRLTNQILLLVVVLVNMERESIDYFALNYFES